MIVLSLNFYRDEVSEFIYKSGFSVDIPKIFVMLDEEYSLLKESCGDAARMQHQVYDMLFLLFEIAAKCNMDLDAEWSKGKEKKKKYLSTDNSVILHNKLVNNKATAICEDYGKEVVTRELLQEECIKALSDKLKEGCDEYVESKNIEELADMLEVMHAICKTTGVEIKEVEKVRVEKEKQRGSFDKRISK